MDIEKIKAIGDKLCEVLFAEDNVIQDAIGAVALTCSVLADQIIEQKEVSREEVVMKLTETIIVACHGAEDTKITVDKVSKPGMMRVTFEIPTGK